MKTTSAILSAVLLSVAPAFAGSAAPTVAQPITPAAASSEWSVRLSLYGWLESLNGDAGVRGFTVPVDVKFSDLLSNLDIAFMGAVEIDHGRWGFVADGIYASLSASGNGPQGFVSADMNLEQFIGNFYVAYEALRTDDVKLDVFAGARVNSLDLSFDIRDSRGGKFSASGSKTWVDPVIGARFQAELPHNFFFRTLGDVGGFDVSSQFTWQALAGFGYHFNEHSSLLLGYRAIGTDYSHSGFTYDITTHGMILGYQYTF